MDYDPDARDHGLPHDPLKALIVPRPIGWISTMDVFGGVNLAPYSYFNLIAEHPAYVMFSSAGRKDSQRNAEETGEFVYNLVTEDLVDLAVACSEPFPSHVGEPEAVGVRMRVRPRRSPRRRWPRPRPTWSVSTCAPSSCPASTVGRIATASS